MNKNLLTLGLTALLSTAGFSQIVTSTVSVGAGYVNHKWYSLENGEVATQAKDNWDIAFEVTGFSSAVLANTQKANFALYYAPFKIADYATLDTVGITNWSVRYNSDTTWTVGAFNKGANLSDATDLGWGNYDMNTHFVNGDSCFVVKLSATSFKKLKIVSLASGAYNFEYANIDGTNPQTKTVAKSAYAGKNFVYFDLTSGTAVDREPVSATWDFMFGRYTGMLQMGPGAATPYPVQGIMQNKGVHVAQANNVASPATYTNFAGETFNTNITTIGHDWKSFDLNNNVWRIVNDTVYFVKDKAGSIWKVRPVTFVSATGDFVFTKEKLAASTVGISENGAMVSKVSVYPNPSNGVNTTLVFSNETNISKLSVSIIDMNGKVVSAENIQTNEGLNTYNLNTNGLQSGIYFVKLNSGSMTATQKLVIQ